MTTADLKGAETVGDPTSNENVGHAAGAAPVAAQTALDGVDTTAAPELEDEGVVFVGVNTKDSSPAQGLAFERRYDVPYPSFFDPAGRTLLAFRGTLNPSAIPSTVVLDEQGRVAASILGEVPSRRTLVDLVRDVQT